MTEPHPPSSVARPPADRHPAVAGRARELLGLADAVRALIDLTVTVDAPADVLVAATDRLARVADRLDAARPDPPDGRFAPYERDEPRGPHDASPFDIVHGLYNPRALPLRMEVVDDLVIGRGTFGPAHGGPPGCVHGAVLIGCFDMVFSTANAQRRVGGPTVRLEARYRHPTRLDESLVFEGRVAEVGSRRVRCEGRVVQAGETTVEAIGHFARLHPDQVATLASRA